jgi:transglutaminase-like putative cysteine protease
MNALPIARAHRWTAQLLLAACTALALANLPGRDLPPAWLLAFALPGALLASSSRLAPRAWQRALLALVLQAGACWLAFELVGPMSRPAALACTILPPLGFATARSHEGDQALALFLSFCVLLVGTILDGLCAPLVAAYGACACMSLRCASHLATIAHSRSARAKHGAFGGTVPLVLGSLLAMLAIDRALAWLPSPSRRAAPSAASGAPGVGDRQVGLDDTFLLDGTRGVLGDVAADVLVRARPLDGASLPGDLYLRSGFFTVPGLDRWQLGTIDPARGAAREHFVLHAPRPGVPVQHLELERSPTALAFVFVPPATCEVSGAFDLVVDGVREWVRQRAAVDVGAYTVSWQALAPPGPDDAVGPPTRELLQLPRDFDRPRYERLLREWNVPKEPLAAMARIAEELARRCRYDRLDPIGPFANAVDNFLFAPADRRGYCMHFASAAALLLRVHGVPCRVAAGVFGGEPDRAHPGARVYGSQHAHAWVEVPFVDRGWVVFDATPPAGRGRAGSGATDAIVSNPPPADDARPEAQGLAARVSELAEQPWFVALLLVLALAASAWPRRRPAAAAIALPPLVANARRLLARTLQALAAAGEHREHGQTLERFASALAARERLAPAVEAAFAAYQRVRFGGRAFDAEHERALRAGLAAAHAMLAPVT